MIKLKNIFYKYYEYLFIKNDELSEEIRNLKYYKKLTDEQLKDLADKERKLLETLKEKDGLDYKIVVEKRRHQFIEYECKECGKKFHEEIPNNSKEENQYGPEVQALELTLMNEANVTMNKTQKVTSGLTNGEIDLSEGYIAKLQERASKKLEGFIKEIIKQQLLHWDDTVIMINTKRSCLRFYGTEKLALYTAHSHKNIH